MQPLLTQLLNLPGIEVENYTNCGEELILEVEATTTQAICPRCQQVSGHMHQNHWYLVRDLSISGRTVFLKVNRRQFKCRTCNKPKARNSGFYCSSSKTNEPLCLGYCPTGSSQRYS